MSKQGNCNMSGNKKSFILYLDQKELFDKLPDEQAGKLIKHIFSYVNCEDPKTDDLIVDIAFSSIKASLKRDLEKWESQKEQRRQAGLASAKKRAERKSTTVNDRSNSLNEAQRNPTVNVSDNVSDSVSDSVNVNEDKYAFLGETIRLNHSDFSKWQKLYPNLNLMNELQQLDMECKGDKKWFMSVSSKLNYRNNKAKERIQHIRPPKAFSQ